MLATITSSTIATPEYKKHIGEIKKEYDLLNDVSKLEAGSKAIEKAEENKMASNSDYKCFK